MLSITNPATGDMIQQLVADSVESIEGKFASCVKAQAKWAQTSIKERKQVIENFRKLLGESIDSCAKATSLETGRPVHQVVSEIQGTDARIGFFS